MLEPWFEIDDDGTRIPISHASSEDLASIACGDAAVISPIHGILDEEAIGRSIAAAMLAGRGR